MESPAVFPVMVAETNGPDKAPAKSAGLESAELPQSLQLIALMQDLLG